MEVGDPLLVLDRICRFYHSKAKFPTQLNELPVEKDADSLMNISTLFDQQLTVSHLARHEFLLIITDGTHGRNLVEYLYRERVFSPERRGGQKASGFYYIYPRRPHASHTANIANPRSWLPGGIPQATRNKLLESVVTLEVVTEENVMTATSIFLIELSNTSPNSVALANTLIDAILRNRATCVFLIFDHQNAKSKDLVTYMGTTASVLESGNPQNAHMFINFDDTSRVGKYTAEICNAFDSALQEAGQDRSYEVTALKQIFRAISIPKDDALLEYLLGASPNQLKPLISNLRNHNFKFDELNTVGMGHASDDDKKDSNNDVNNGMDSIMELLKTMAFNKVKHSIDKLERDIEHLHNISNR
ncbi:hypothetical protein X943_000116 [Babesia divergens]|uniref:Uncharacterized protein n=1 Tax=Babesia divergens TaxID=32595 RepID=A0AAD9LHP3_BABDI|nr:hypothetical protein X943_000116 [Babesia divergens]